MRGVRLALLISTSLALVACAALLDIKELVAPPDAASPTGDGAARDASCAPDQPADIVGQVTVGAVAIDPEKVYFTDVIPGGFARVLSCDRCSCTKPTELARGAVLPAVLWPDDTYLFWSDADETEGGVHRVDKRTGQGHVKVPHATPFGLAADDTHVYFAALGTAGATGPPVDQGIWRLDKASMAPASKERLYTGVQKDEIIQYALALDDEYVYWTNTPELSQNAASSGCTANDAGAPFNGSVRRIRKDRTGSVELLATGLPCPVSLAVDADNVYWTTLGATVREGAVWTVPKTPPRVPRMLASQQTAPLGLAISGGAAFWTWSVARGAILRCALPGCGQIDPLVTNEPAPSTIALGEGVLTWGNQGVPGTTGAVRWMKIR